jgi:hypothetical protein
MIAFGTRPRSLFEVARRYLEGAQPFDPAVRELLDHFYSHPDLREASIQERPDKIDAVHDAYLAAVAEHLARSFDLAVPDWTEEQGNELHIPFFAGGLESLKGILVAESPTAFRRRLLFVSKDALSRPRLP